MADLPILYSFRRCPYAMRARLALQASGQRVELREVVLRDKPAEMLEASPKATVPVLVLPDGTVLEESRDIMAWTLAQNDLEGWLDYPHDILEAMDRLVDQLDGPFKASLDRYKYENRHEGVSAKAERDKAAAFVMTLDGMLCEKPFLFGNRFSFADGAILPFVRQYAHVDREWFRQQDWTYVLRWLDGFLDSDRFARVMEKYPQWEPGDAPVIFPG